MIKTQVMPTKMEQLLGSAKNKILPKQGDLVEGNVIFVGRNEILIDIDEIMTGLIRGHEAYDESGEYNNLKVGDHVTATVLDIENERGILELSIKQAGHKKAWDNLEKMQADSKVVSVNVLEANKGGLVVKLDQVFGFLPVSQLSPKNYPRVVGGNKNKILEKLKSLVGEKLDVIIIDINDEEGTLIVSERAVEKDQRKQALNNYKKGDIIEGKVTGVVDFGAFIEFDHGLEGLIHISELGWQRIDNPREVVKEGDKIKVQIIEVSDSKVSLSLKRLTKDPWEDIKDKYKIGDKVKAKVIKFNEFGVFVEIMPMIQGLARVRGGTSFKDPGDSDNKVEIGKEYNFTITNFEPLDHKLGLELND
ncbi:30S ribosomal protein S1 [Candidatus Kuenenbacteria bacterium CG11_big_fil_rev_8_21_14_0_20_37_9]|uniref:30S ribosomal protein S1 n=1 Tax=Candidatus Kuenenbacteria bacterium CG08_land_8_20_14_0_20_37_23 TaxID=1974617 RepID=A0A2M6XSK4_9BACT|nr:MAG: 30S ribosomal protein S1 [Candidatus Kuenenbacteria bacterium CG11_big_fil_rev_8_21_14_0_20_37_9]PIU10617.1 MAG: 30S ribosomal protein S1 [Candidatus Kuenenbacteria bacterium CG08_land_8_20_14_0_20_37_23]